MLCDIEAAPFPNLPLKWHSLLNIINLFHLSCKFFPGHPGALFATILGHCDSVAGFPIPSVPWWSLSSLEESKTPDTLHSDPCAYDLRNKKKKNQGNKKQVGMRRIAMFSLSLSEEEEEEGEEEEEEEEEEEKAWAGQRREEGTKRSQEYKACW